MKTKGKILLAISIVALIMVIILDQVLLPSFEKKFIELERQRIITSNKLATAKIVQENLNHVKELVTMNMDFAHNHDSVSNESHFFNFLTTCINDLKLKLINNPNHLSASFKYEMIWASWTGKSISTDLISTMISFSTNKSIRKFLFSSFPLKNKGK